MRGRTRPYEERDTSLRREGRVPKIDVRIWQNPQEDFIKSTAGFGQILCRIFRVSQVTGKQGYRKRKNLTGVELKLLQRSFQTSAEKFAKFCREPTGRHQSSFCSFLKPCFPTICKTRKILQRICPNPAVDLMKSSRRF